MDLGQKTWLILQLWYKEAYESISARCLKLKNECEFWCQRYKEMSASRDHFRQTNRLLNNELQNSHATTAGLQNLINEIFTAYPEVRAAYETNFGSDTESEPESEDLFDTSVARRLTFE